MKNVMRDKCRTFVPHAGNLKICSRAPAAGRIFIEYGFVLTDVHRTVTNTERPTSVKAFEQTRQSRTLQASRMHAGHADARHGAAWIETTFARVGSDAGTCGEHLLDGLGFGGSAGEAATREACMCDGHACKGSACRDFAVAAAGHVGTHGELTERLRHLGNVLAFLRGTPASPSPV
jgi:hypothetical protein